MTLVKRSFLTLTQVVVANFLTAITGVFGAPFMRALRLSRGAFVYWMLAILSTGAAHAISGYWVSSLIGSVWLCVGIYCEMEKAHIRLQIASLISVLIAGGAFVFSAYYTLKSHGVGTWLQYVDFIEKKVKEMSATAGFPQVDAGILAGQSVSAIVIMLILSLAVSLMLEKKIFNWFSIERIKSGNAQRLLEFRVPDFVQWITMVAALVAFMKGTEGAAQIVAMNVFNIAVAIYFLQGLAIVEFFFKALRVGFLPRLILYFLVVGQMFFVLSAIGFIDFWVDFRFRLKKGMTRTKDNSRFGGSL